MRPSWLARTGTTSKSFATNPMTEMDAERERVVELVRSAFADVRLGDGIGLRQAQGLDDYETRETVEAYREADEKDRWSAIPAKDLERCSSSLSFFDAEGMRFHLPAYLVAELEGTIFHCVVFPLIDLDEYRMKQYGLLSAAQRHAVCEFLSLLVEDPEFEFERKRIERAIADFWGK